MIDPTSLQLVTDAKARLGKRLRASKGSFYLGLILFGAGFTGFSFLALPDLALSTGFNAWIGFGVGIWYLAGGLLWSLVWSLSIHLSLLIDDVGLLIESLLQQVLGLLRATFQSGAIVDLDVVQTHIRVLIEKETVKFGAETVWVPLVNEWAPLAAREGMRVLVVHVAGQVFTGEQITLSTLEQSLGKITAGQAVKAIQPILRWVAILLFPVALLWMFIPVGIVKLVALVVGMI